MRILSFPILFLGVFLHFSGAEAQSMLQPPDKIPNLPGHWIQRMEERITTLSRQLTSQTEQYLQQMAMQEKQMQRKISCHDSAGAQTLFAGAEQRYAALSQKLATDTGSPTRLYSSTYKPYLDSLHGSLAYLQQHPDLLNGSPAKIVQLQKTSSQLQALEARMQDADRVKSYLQQRKQQIASYISGHPDLRGLLNGQFTSINKDVFYYSQELRSYKEIWNKPGELEQRALALLNRTPDFQSFMKAHSSLGSLFQVPRSYGTPQGLAGLQTKEVVAAQVQAKVSPAGPAGIVALQSSLQTAQTDLDGYKQKLSALGEGNADVDRPDFTPSDQHTKTFWRRLEYGTNFQTTRTNYYFPTVSDLGVSLGYRLGHNNVIGIGASYKLGWGNGIQHITFSSQGVGLRSYVQIKVKGSFSATGGFEYNYTTPFPAFSQLPRIQDWTKSGLIGITKTITTRGRVLKKTNLSLLWDYLSYRQIPPTQPLLFRVGYTLN